MHYRLWSGDCKEVRYHYTLTCKLDESCTMRMNTGGFARTTCLHLVIRGNNCIPNSVSTPKRLYPATTTGTSNYFILPRQQKRASSVD